MESQKKSYLYVGAKSALPSMGLHVNYPVSCSHEHGRIWKSEEIRGFLSPWYRVFTNEMRISTKAEGMESLKI